MHKPDPLSRRSMLAGMAVAIPATAVALPVVNDADAELVNLYRQWEAAVVSSDAANLLDDLPDEDANRIFGDEADLQAAIVQRPAHTLAGLRLKARVALRAAELHSPIGEGRALLDYATETEGPASSIPAALAVVLDLVAMEPA